MKHLYNSRVKVQRMEMTRDEDGRTSLDWVDVPSLRAVDCRLDLNFLRPGKDVAAAPEAGRRPDRVGVMFTSKEPDIRAGDRIVTVANKYGKMPVNGTFEIRTYPDEAQNFADTHHVEVQIIEALNNGQSWPDDEVIP